MAFSPIFQRPFSATFDRRAAAAAGVNWSQWFDHCWVAKGAASLAASYADLVGTTAITTASAPGFGASGWDFDGIANYLDTGVLVPSTPAYAADWTFMVQYSDFLSVEGVATIFGAYNVRCSPRWWGGISSANTGAGSTKSPVLLAGNFCLAGQDAYRNGVFDDTKTAGLNRDDYMNIGCGISDGARSRFAAVKVQAFGIKHSTLDATGVAAARAAMAAL